uniref:RRM domain-containing protein n=1 Tax=Spongospora subterranea TaxID=70186 RepID=A0A0H5RAV6_9EUKA|eukprot:CRZ11188.1 hypothetical protein [Spongospora subterranea]
MSKSAAVQGLCALRIHPVPSYLNVARMQAFVEEANVTQFLAVFKKPNRSHGVITFQSENDRDAALERLKALKRQDSELPYTIQECPFVNETSSQKRLREDSYQKSTTKKLRNSGVADYQETIVKSIPDVVTPWLKFDYQTQLAKKFKLLQDALTSIIASLRKDYKLSAASYPTLDLKGVGRQAVVAQLHDYQSLDVVSSVEVETTALSPFMACPIESIHGWANGQQGYRNKNDLTIGLNMADEICVGFNIGRHAGRLVIESGSTAVNLPEITARIAKDVEEFIRQSGYAAFQQMGNDSESTGVWRRILIRTAATTSSVMLAFSADLSRLSDTEVTALKERIAVRWPADTYSSESFDGRSWSIRSISIQSFSGYGNIVPTDLPYDLILGDPYIVEYLGPYQFQIQPSSFFQVNTQAARLLYDIVGSWSIPEEPLSSPSSYTILTDVCCGTGTIGMSLHDRVSEVAGFELIESAVNDARENAARNGLDRCRFFVGKAEDTLSAGIKERLSSCPPSATPNVVCVVDPPRPGLHKSVLKTIRSCSQIKRLVYVSCNPKSMAVDLTALLRPESDKRPGAAFRPIKATLVDMFPHTEHCESVVLLVRE